MEKHILPYISITNKGRVGKPQFFSDHRRKKIVFCIPDLTGLIGIKERIKATLRLINLIDKFHCGQTFFMCTNFFKIIRSLFTRILSGIP